jgi:DNA polymerase-3 subunit alpha
MTQFAMDAIAQLGLLKLDFLGLGNLTILGEARDLVTQAYSIPLDLRTIPLDDIRTFELLSSGETTGLFQVEGTGMRRYIKELRPTSLNDIAAMIALYRPGPMEHIDTFIKAKHGSASIHYPHPDLEEILRDTYGVIVYQDQVLLILQRFAGYSLGEADIVRKAMGKKISELMRQEKENFIRGAQSKGHPQELAEQIFALIEPFAGYAFNKAHSVSYAMIAYWTAYFKANYPEEYLTALLNAQSGNIERIAATVSECHRLKIPVLPPSINDSDVGFSVDRDHKGSHAIRFGLAAVKNVGSATVEQIVNNRNQDGPFLSLDSFCRSIGYQGLNRRTLESLIKVGALDNFGDRGAILANLDRMLSLAQQEAHLQNVGQSTMFDLFGETVATPLSSIVLGEDHAMPREKLSWEKELLGVYFSENPLSGFVAPGNSGVIVTKEQINESLEGKTINLVGQISSTRQLMTKQQRQFIVVNVELMDGSIEVLVWPEALERTRGVWSEGIFVQIAGKVRKRDDRLSVYCDQAHEFELPPPVPVAEIMPLQNQKPVPALVTSPYEEGITLSEDTINSTFNVREDGLRIANGNGHTNDTSGNRSVHIRFTETESQTADAQLLHEVLRAILEFPGQDRVYLDISTNGTSVKLEMEQITTGFCDDLQTQLQDLLGGNSVSVEQFGKAL